MAHYCSDCENLNLKKEKYPGCCNCKKKKADVWACDDACDKFSYDWSRPASKRKDIYATAFREKKKDHSKITGAQLFGMLILFFVIWLMAVLSK